MSFRSGSSSNSSFGVRDSTYDVFFSFRGEDTRKNFTSHLYHALDQAGIYTYRDDIALPKGGKISKLLKAIELSRISIVVFSKGYASSTWCLEELAKIMECKNTISQIVLPVFYDIEPSDIRKQKRSFAEAFTVHEERFKEEMEKVNKWRGALKEASNLSGYSLKDMANGHESTFIQNIVEDVLKKLNHKYFQVAKHPVGIDSRVCNMLHWLRTRRNDVRIVGIYGMPGIGKTTIAKFVFNQLYDGFEGSCFLKNVVEKAQQPNGLVHLQEELLRDILKRDNWKINNEDRGINLIRERLCHKRVLVVLDNVEQQKQLDALIGDGCLFGLGSIIIITTRNEDLLNGFKVVVKYKAQLLNENESLQLFNLHAFGDTCRPEDYVKLSNKIVDHCKGLPLALEVLGSCLFKKDKRRWESVIDKLKNIPKDEIQEKLGISFYELEDDAQKNTFLDIACFFIDRKKTYVLKVLEARCGYNPEDDLETLIERSLITVNDLGQITMHNLLRDMGREIIRKMSPNRLGERNRIWDHEDAWDVLIKQMGTEVVEGLALDVRASKVEPLKTESFTKMKYLQLLKINGVLLTGCFKVLPKGLIWLCWYGCPLKSLPSDFELSNLVILDMKNSNIKELWKETKILNKLKILNLSYCKHLVKTPNFLGLSNLERLILKHCTSLAEVPQSIGHLKMLVLLNLEGCSRLKILSESICDVKSLKTLNISWCLQLEKLPEHMNDMESLTELLADGIQNEQLLSSIVHFKFVKMLSLRGYSFSQDSPSSTSWLSSRGLNWKALLPTSLVDWNLLRELDLGYCGFSEDATNCVDFGSLSSLEELDLSGNKFLNLPSGIGRLPKLRDFTVKDCKDLLLISDLPSSLQWLSAAGCTSMERIRVPLKSDSLRLYLILHDCRNLMAIEGLETLQGIFCPIYFDHCYRLWENYKRSFVEASSNREWQQIDFHNDEIRIPDWFSYRVKESSLSFHLPLFFLGFVFWVVYESPALISLKVSVKKKSNGIQLYGYYLRVRKGVASWVSNVKRRVMAIKEHCGEELELQICDVDRSGMKVKEIGLHVIADNPDSFEESKAELEWDHDIGNIQGTSSTDVEEGDEIDSPTGTVIMRPKPYHHPHHPPLGSTAFSANEQWKFYLLKEVSVRNVSRILTWPY